MAEYLIQDTTLDAIADAINAKTGGSSAMTPAQMVTAIGSISTGAGSPKVYTVDYTPSANSQSVSIPLQFSYAPVFAYIYADADNLPSAPPVSVVKNIILININVTDSTTSWNIDKVVSGRKTYTIKAGGGTDYWSSTPTGTVANNALTVDVSNKSLYFYAGVTYHVVAVEV